MAKTAAQESQNAIENGSAETTETAGTTETVPLPGSDEETALAEGTALSGETPQAGEITPPDETRQEPTESPSQPQELPTEESLPESPQEEPTEESQPEDTENPPLEEVEEELFSGSPANPVHHCTKKNDGTDTTDWSYVYFGSYPQTEVTGSELTSAITGAGYDGNGDAWVGGTKYRRISKSDTNYDGYFGDSTYRYFKWERIKWRVLKNDGSTLFLVADRGLDCKDYNEEYKSITWENCTLRSWLNGTFYSTAFSSEEKGAVVPQTVVNEDNPEYNTEGGNNTNDKVYLLSIGEVTDPSYGFCEDYGTYSVSRRVQASDYSHAMGAGVTTSDTYRGNRYWWLRSPGYRTDYAAHVSHNGNVRRIGDSVNDYNDALVPALHINLSSGLWSLADNGTSGEGGGSGTAGENPGGDSQNPGAGGQNPGGSVSDTGEDSQNPGGDSQNPGAGGQNPGESVSDTGGDSQNPGGNSQSRQKIKVKKLSISGISKKIAAGKKISLKVSVSPKNASNPKVTWKTGNKKYATVNSKGVVTTKKAGKGKTVKITAEAKDGSGKKATYKIKIMKNAVTKVQIKKPGKTLKAGKSMTLKAAVKTNGKNANKSLKWTVSNKKYASVNSRGKVTAKKAGKGKTVTVTAMSTDGTNKKAKVRLTIK